MDNNAEFGSPLARKVVEQVARDAVKMLFMRHGSVIDINEVALTEVELEQDVVNLLLGDELGCLDPEDVSDDNCTVLAVEKLLPGSAETGGEKAAPYLLQKVTMPLYVFVAVKEFLMDWRKGDFQLPKLASLDAEAIESALDRWDNDPNFPRTSQNQTVSSGVEGAHEGTTADKAECESCETLQTTIDAGRAEDARMTHEILKLEERIRLTEPLRPEIPCVRKLIAALNQYESFPTVANFALIKAAWAWIEAEPINICPIHNKKQPCCGPGSREPEKLNNAQKSSFSAVGQFIYWRGELLLEVVGGKGDRNNTALGITKTLNAAALAESSLSSQPPDYENDPAHKQCVGFSDWNALLYEICKFYAKIDPEWADADIDQMDEFDPWEALRKLEAATFRQSSSRSESGAESAHSGKQNTADKSELLPTQLPKDK